MKRMERRRKRNMMEMMRRINWLEVVLSSAMRSSVENGLKTPWLKTPLLCCVVAVRPRGEGATPF